MANYRIWSMCENYLNAGNVHYSITGTNRNSPVIYRTESQKSVISKIIQIVSYLLVFPPLASFAICHFYRTRYAAIKAMNTKQYDNESVEDCKAIATKDCNDTHEWRKKLISVAEHNIVISGNYCGGKSFDDLLKAIDGRMDVVPNLQVILIAHPRFVENNKRRNVQNKELIKKIRAKYKNRFSFIDSSDGFLGNKRITNHTKCTVIDYGKYFIQGGSGIKDNFYTKGTLDDSTKTIQKQRIKDDMDLSNGRAKKNTKNYAKDDSHINRPRKIQKKKGEEYFLDKILPGAFRDQDFVFQTQGTGETGKLVYQQALFLALKWDQHTKNGQMSNDSWDLRKLDENDPIFKRYPALAPNSIDHSPTPEEVTNKSTGSANKRTALESLLKAQTPDLDQIIHRRDLPAFTSDKSCNVAMKIFCTGPEDRQSIWEDNLVNRIEKAKKRILIDQMYFQPSKRIMTALVKAANERNVRITIVTTIGGKHSPMGEKFFGRRNKYNLRRFFSSIHKNKKKNIQMYTYSQAKNGLHKKVVITDDYVLSGSSNMGTKSLSFTSDHEMNFEARSDQLAKHTIEIIKEDIKRSRKLKSINLGFKDRIIAAVHRIGAFWWG